MGVAKDAFDLGVQRRDRVPPGIPHTKDTVTASLR